MGMGKPLVVYHAGCQDGFTAAWAAWEVLGETADYLPASYGGAPPEVVGREVFLLDFSYKRSAVEKLLESNPVTVLDHHRTAWEELGDLSRDGFRFVFDNERSGAALAWEFFHPGKKVPALVRYVQDRDLWRWQEPCSREVNAWLGTQRHDFANWNRVARELDHYPNWLAVIPEGMAVLRYQGQIVDAHVRQAVEVTIAGHMVLACNATTMMSEVAGKLAEGRPFGATWRDRPNGLRSWSLRSTPEGVDVAAVARSLGGGGHRHAAGFEEKLA